MNKNIIAGFGKAIQFAIWGAGGGAIGALIAEPFFVLMIQQAYNSLSAKVFTSSIWFGLIGAGIAIALLSASFQYLKRGLQLGKAIRDGIWVGFLAGAIAGGIAEYLYSSIGPTEFLRIICWGIAGVLLGLGLSFRIPNLGQIRGMGGGLAGGILGGGLFVLLAVVSGSSETAARLLGSAAIGFCIGLMIAIIETAFREVWLEIRYNPKESRTVSLGSEPVSIGGDPNICTVYARNAPPVALRYQLTQGQILCEDIPAGTTHTVRPGDQQMVGAIAIVVCAAAASPQLVSSSPDLASQYPSQTVLQSQNQFSLRLKRRVIALTDGTRLSPQEIPGLEPQNADNIVAEVSHNPKDPTILGLKNCSCRSWIATLPSGEQKQIDPGRNIKLAAATKINFGSVAGEIC